MFDTSEAFRDECVEIMERILKQSTYPSVKMLNIASSKFKDTPSILRLFQAGNIENLLLDSYNTETMNEIYELDQWKMAKSVSVDCDISSVTFENYAHLENICVRGGSSNVFPVQLAVEIRDILMKSPNFKNAIFNMPIKNIDVIRVFDPNLVERRVFTEDAIRGKFHCNFHGNNFKVNIEEDNFEILKEPISDCPWESNLF